MVQKIKTHNQGCVDWPVRTATDMSSTVTVGSRVHRWLGYWELSGQWAITVKQRLMVKEISVVAISIAQATQRTLAIHFGTPWPLASGFFGI